MKCIKNDYAGKFTICTYLLGQRDGVEVLRIWPPL